MDQQFIEFVLNQGGVVAVLIGLIWFVAKYVYPDFIKKPYEESMKAQRSAAENAEQRAIRMEERAIQAQDQVLQLMAEHNKAQHMQNENSRRLADEITTLIAVTKQTQDMIDDCMNQKEGGGE